MSAILDAHGIAFPDRPVPSVVHPMREHHETWLYFHLVQAANARLEMERERSWCEYEEARISRANSVAQASKHYRALLSMGPVIEPLLDRMAMTEGLTP